MLWDLGALGLCMENGTVANSYLFKAAGTAKQSYYQPLLDSLLKLDTTHFWPAPGYLPASIEALSHLQSSA